MTVKELLKIVLRKVNVIASGETPDNDILVDSLEALNMMLQSWAADGVTLTGTVKESFPLTGGKYSYTWGTGGDFATPPPADIVSAAINSGNVKQSDLKIIGPNSYRKITDKTASGTPVKLHLNPGYPTATVYLYPVPEAGLTLEIDTVKPIDGFASINDTLTLPPEALFAVKGNLATELAAEYGRQVAPITEMRARDSYLAIQGQTVKNGLMDDTTATPFSRPGRFNINLLDD